MIQFLHFQIMLFNVHFLTENFSALLFNDPFFCNFLFVKFDNLILTSKTYQNNLSNTILTLWEEKKKKTVLKFSWDE